MRAALLGALLMLATPAAAQLPPEVGAELRRLGAAMGPDAVRANGAATAPLMPPAVVEPLRDRRYGPDERHRLDVFSPGAGARPVLVFVHGGGFRGGDKTQPGTHYYDNIGQWAARQGWVGVTITYRLAPAHPFPAVVEDIGLALAWVRANIAEQGGDPARILLMGQSAGAAHVADYLATHADAPGVAAAALVSGVYDAASYPPGPTAGSYYGSDPTLLAQRSAIPGLVRLRVPLLLARAELEPAPFREQAALLHAALCAARPGCAPILELDGHTHFSTVFAFGGPETRLADAVRNLLP